jgi:hypothetical protein
VDVKYRFVQCLFPPTLHIPPPSLASRIYWQYQQVWIWILTCQIWASHCVKMSMLFFWVVTPCGLVGRYKRFGGTYCLHLQGKYLPTSPHWGEYLYLRGMKRRDAGQTCIMRSCINCTIQQILLGWSTKEDEIGGARSAHGGDEKCVQTSDWKAWKEKATRKI